MKDRIAAGFTALWSQAYILLTFTALFWAGNAIVARGAKDLVPPIALAFWRWGLALAIILPFAWRHLQRDRKTILRNPNILILLGCLGIGAFNTLLYTGLQDTTALNAMLLQSGQPALILLAGVVLMGDRSYPRQIVGAIVAMAGVLTIIAEGRIVSLIELRFNFGDLVITLAVLLWAIYAVMLRRRPAIHPMSLFAVTLIVGIVAIAPFYVWEINSGQFITAHHESWLALGYVAIFPAILAYLFFNRGVELIGSAATGIYMNIMPLLGAGLASLLLGERLYLYHFAGMALIFGGILLAGRGQTPLGIRAY